VYEFEFLSDLTTKTSFEIHGAFRIGWVSCKFEWIYKLSQLGGFNCEFACLFFGQERSINQLKSKLL